MTYKNKITGVVALAVILTAGLSVTQHLYAARAYWVTPKPPSQLQEDYSRFNSAWFAGGLPVNVIVEYTATPYKLHVMGLTDVVDGHFVIYIDPKYHADSKAADMTLFHEICHIRVWDAAVAGDEHGAPWKACMVQLAEKGAFDGLW
jgi:SprT-like family